MSEGEIEYLTKQDILDLHEIVIENDEEAEGGVRSEGSIDYAVEFIEHGSFGQKPETIHEKAYQLMRLLAANHGFVDGNKRTALSSTATFYSLNGFEFSYGEEIKAILKLLAINERFVNEDEVVNYFSEIATETGPALSNFEEIVMNLNETLLDFLVEEGEIEDTEDGEISKITIEVPPPEDDSDQADFNRLASLSHVAREIDDIPDINIKTSERRDEVEQNQYASEDRKEDQ